MRELRITPDVAPTVKNYGAYEMLLQLTPDLGEKLKKHFPDRRDPEWGDPSWYEATVLLHDGYIYMVDEGDDITVEEINDGLCWFRGRYMMYHVIPE